MIEAGAPEHLDRWSRNERLYRYLLGLGLVVHPIFEDSDRTRIDHLLVGSEYPLALPESGQRIGEEAAMTSVVPPAERSQVGMVIDAAQAGGDRKVINFPAIF